MTGTSLAGSKSGQRWARGIGLASLMGLLCLAPLAVEAQSTGKRSATSGKRGSTSTTRRGAPAIRRSTSSLQRSVGSEKKSSTTTSKRGGDSFSETARNGSESSQSDRFDDDQDEYDWGEDDSSDADFDDDASSDDSEAEPEDFSTRTLGKSCMYGVRGEVIFRPAGSLCRGDRPAARAPAVAPAAGRKRPKAPKAQKVRRRARPTADSPSASRGSCIVGGDGRVLYAPAGVDCRR